MAKYPAPDSSLPVKFLINFFRTYNPELLELTSAGSYVDYSERILIRKDNFIIVIT